MIAKQCQNFSQRKIAAASDARLNGSFEFVPLARQDADVGEILGFTSAVAGQVACGEQFSAYRVAHLGALLALADLQRPEPQLIMPARQHGIEGGPFWQIAQLQNSQRKFLHT